MANSPQYRNPSGKGCEAPVDEIRWRPEKDGTRTCPWCGSLHPDDFLDIVWRYTQREEGYSFSTTDKGWYKFYANRPGVSNAGDGGIKFYGMHLPVDKRDEARAAIELACVVQAAEWQERMKQWRTGG